MTLRGHCRYGLVTLQLFLPGLLLPVEQGDNDVHLTYGAEPYGSGHARRRDLTHSSPSKSYSSR